MKINIGPITDQLYQSVAKVKERFNLGPKKSRECKRRALQSAASRARTFYGERQEFYELGSEREVPKCYQHQASSANVFQQE